MNSRGEYGQGGGGRGSYGNQGRSLTRKPVTIGVTLYHSVEDRAAAVKQLDLDWDVLYQDIASQAGELIRDPSRASGYRQAGQLDLAANPPDPVKVAWFKSYVAPLSSQWKKFRTAQLGGSNTLGDSYIAFAERWQTNWDTYEDWKKKLDVLREDAQKRGFVLRTTAPTALPTTVWADAAQTVEQGARAVASGIGDVWPIVKYGAWAALGIGAVVALSSVAQNLRKGHDPAERFLGMIRSPRSASRALALSRYPRSTPSELLLEGTS